MNLGPTTNGEPPSSAVNDARIGAVNDAETVTFAGSFDVFYREHRARVARTLALTLGNDELGFEAADEAMARAFERWNTVAHYQNPEGWVYRTGHNWARSWLRRRARAVGSDPLLNVQATPAAPGVDPDLARAIAGLSREHREVVVLRFFRDWSVDTVADALGVAPGTVKSRLSRAVDQLQRVLSPNAVPPNAVPSNDPSPHESSPRVNTETPR